MSECFTSAFVLFELVTGLEKPDPQFGVRKACIANLLELNKSGLDIVWMLPIDCGKAAFQYLGHKPDHIGRFLELIQCVDECKCWQEFLELLAGRGLDAYFTRLMREHAEIIDVVMGIRGAPSLIPKADAFFERCCPGATEDQRLALREWVLRELPRYHTAQGRTMIAFAKRWTLESIPSATERDVQLALDSYNGSMDLFIQGLDVALARPMSEHMSHRHKIDENDFADLLHLIYLRKGDILVSEEGRDTLVSYAAREIGVPVKHIDELKS